MQLSFVNFSKKLKMRIVRQIISQALIVVCLVSFVGVTFQAHTCLLMNKTSYSVAPFPSNSCCSDEDAHHTNNSVEEKCCSDLLLYLKIEDSFTCQPSFQVQTTNLFAETNTCNKSNLFLITNLLFANKSNQASLPILQKHRVLRC